MKDELIVEQHLSLPNWPRERFYMLALLYPSIVTLIKIRSWRGWRESPSSTGLQRSLRKRVSKLVDMSS